MTIRPLALGSRIQEYEITEVLGVGAFGIIYVAANSFLSETVAIKEFAPAGMTERTAEGTLELTATTDLSYYQWAREKFLKEAQILHSLSQPVPHPNLVRVSRFAEQNGTAYIIMDFEQGEPLSSVLERVGTLDESKVKALFSGLLSGLKRVHASGVLHRDIKPSNIIIRPNGVPVLIDFGAARQDMSGIEESIMAVFTPTYAAPEQVSGFGDQGPWTDIYCLAGVAYRALFGKAPVASDARALGHAHISALEHEGNVSRATRVALDAALALRAEERPQTVDEWIEMLGLHFPASDPDGPTQVGPRPLPAHGAAVSPAVRASSGAQTSQNSISIRKPMLALVGAGTVILLTFVFYLLRGGDNVLEEGGTAQTLPLERGRSPSTDAELAISASEKPGGVQTGQALAREIPAELPLAGCANIQFLRTPSGGYQLSGYVAEQWQAEDALTRIPNSEAINIQSTQLAILGPRFCSYLESIRQVVRNDATLSAPKILLRSSDSTLRNGDFLEFDIVTPAELDGYVYVDYLDNENRVVHLLPNPTMKNNRFTAGSRVAIGSGEGGQRRYEIVPPHGLQMIFVLVTEQPLDFGRRDEIEDADRYEKLFILAASEASRTQSRISYAFAVVTTTQ